MGRLALLLGVLKNGQSAINSIRILDSNDKQCLPYKEKSNFCHIQGDLIWIVNFNVLLNDVWLKLNLFWHQNVIYYKPIPIGSMLRLESTHLDHKSQWATTYLLYVCICRCTIPSRWGLLSYITIYVLSIGVSDVPYKDARHSRGECECGYTRWLHGA